VVLMRLGLFEVEELEVVIGWVCLGGWWTTTLRRSKICNFVSTYRIIMK
jgi:hypothetical protein